MTATQEVKTPRELHAAGIVTSRPFFPPTSWAPLERVRERHERALAEMRAARVDGANMEQRHREQRVREERTAAARVLDGEPAVDLAEAEDARRREVEAHGARVRAAQLALHGAVVEGLRLVERHGEWRAEVAERRAAAEAERDELLARAAVAGERARAEGHMLAWLAQAAERPTPQPFSEPGPPPSAATFTYGGAGEAA